MQDPNEVNVSKISKDFQWIVDTLGEAHLPTLMMPKQWSYTEKKHQATAFDPTQGIAKNLETGKVTKRNKVGFIKTTKKDASMPGTEQPDAVRYERFFDPEFQKSLVQDEEGKWLAPCLVHGDYVYVEALQSDHAAAKDGIIERQKKLIELLNNDEQLANIVLKQPGMNKFFVKTRLGNDKTDKIYGTYFFYEIYFNDIDNIWLICQACNLHKSDENFITWLKDKWLYGQEFFEYVVKESRKDKNILQQLKDKRGLAQVAIDWFWDRHGTYVSICKNFYEDVKIPITILNRQLDVCIGEGRYKEAEVREAYLNFRINLMQQITSVPLEKAEESAVSEMQQQLTPGTRLRAMEETVTVADPLLAEAYEKNVKVELSKRTREEEGANIDKKKPFTKN